MGSSMQLRQCVKGALKPLLFENISLECGIVTPFIKEFARDRIYFETETEAFGFIKLDQSPFTTSVR